MAFTEKGRQEVIDGALALLAFHEEKNPHIHDVSPREVWASLKSTEDTHWLTIVDVQNILKEAGFHSRYDGKTIRISLVVK